VPRPHLVARLSQGLTLPLTLISAPAGFGKTTLVSEWRASNAGRDYPVAWLSLENDDNDPIRFLTYLVAALGKLKPDLAEIALGMLQSPQPPPLEAFLTGLINDLAEMSNPFALVLDDYHVITSQPVHQALTFILDHLPQQMHLVLLTRADPPLPLGRLRARNQLVELRADDLRFTTAEAAAFFNQVMGLALSADDLAGLDHRTEGWIAGLQLAALAIQTPRPLQGAGDTASFITGFTGSHHYVVDYLVSEVLSRQPESVRSFLLQTSILERMTGGLCDRLMERSDGQTMLRQLEEANLFLVPLDEECRWYRYHHLFAEVLRNQLRQAYPNQLPELHRRAAEWFEQNGLVSEAIHHALAAGDQARAARLVEQNALPMLMRGDAVTVLNWINSMTPLVQERPWLGVYQSWAFICTAQLDRLEASLQGVEKLILSPVPETEAQAMRSQIAAVRALAAVRQGEAKQAIDLAHQALELLPESDTTIRTVVIYTLGEANVLAGDLVGAQRAFAEVGRNHTAAGNLLAAVVALCSSADLLCEQAELHRAAETYRAAVQMATRSDGRMLPAAARACLGLSGLEYEWNNLDEARRNAQQSLEMGRRWGNPDHLAGTHLMRARLQQAEGDAAGALESLREAEDLARGQGVAPRTVHHIAALRVRLLLAQNNLEALTGWAHEHSLDPDDEISFLHQIAYLTLARILMAQSQVETALTLLERLLGQVEALGQTGLALDVLVLQSLALEQKGDTSRALTVLTRALSLGQSGGYVRVFLDEGAPMAKLLRYAGSHGVSPKYVAGLLSQFDREIGAASTSQQPLIEPLTERELQVLHLLADGLSNQAIAEKLVVALGTVKTHTASLFRKLDVTSRTQAAVRARELGLL